MSATKKNIKYVCECGSSINNDLENIGKHLKTNKHLNFIKAKDDIKIKSLIDSHTNPPKTKKAIKKDKPDIKKDKTNINKVAPKSLREELDDMRKLQKNYLHIGNKGVIYDSSNLPINSIFRYNTIAPTRF